jgi:hypothetical protein
MPVAVCLCALLFYAVDCFASVLCLLPQAAREAAKRHAIEKGLQDIDRTRPIADPQDTGLIKGRKAAKQQQQQQQQVQQQEQG